MCVPLRPKRHDALWWIAAIMFLNSTEDALIQLTDTLMKAKEIAIQNASGFYDGDIRRNVANEVLQLRNHALSIANKRI